MQVNHAHNSQAPGATGEEDENGYMNANIDQSEGGRKEIPQINETGNQARSKYFPSHGSSGGQNGQPVQKIRL